VVTVFVMLLLAGLYLVTSFGGEAIFSWSWEFIGLEWPSVCRLIVGRSGEVLLLSLPSRGPKENDVRDAKIVK
jgi:hypothetical protein